MPRRVDLVAAVLLAPGQPLEQLRVVGRRIRVEQAQRDRGSERLALVPVVLVEKKMRSELLTVEPVSEVQIPELDDTQGLIWFYEPDETRLGHDGDDPGTSALMFFDPTDGTGALVVANGMWPEDEEAAYALLEALFAEAKAG